MDYYTFLEAFKLFDIPLFNQSFLEMLMRLILNLIVVYLIIHFIYEPTRKNSEYVFTFMIFSPLIFFICHLFSKVELSIGFAFGLFAVFSILRYRTTQIQVKEMTYMFIVISLAVINALATATVSYTELMFTNIFIVCMTYILERYALKSSIKMRTVKYEVIENIKPENTPLLLQDLEERIGTSIERFEIVEADYVRDIAVLRVFYK